MFLAAVVVFAVAACILGARVIEATTKVVPARGGEYAEGSANQPAYINPVIAEGDTDRALVRLMFSNIPDIADSITSPDGGTTWKVRLKENLLWSDGQKLTSDDVIFTVMKIQDPEAHSPLAADWQGITVSRESELELQFTLGTPYAFFPETLRELYVLPKHLYADTPVANWQLSDFNLRPVGSGPYMFDSFEKQKDGFVAAYFLKSNPNYQGTRPPISRVRFVFFGDESRLIDAFNAGEIDGFMNEDPATFSKIRRSYQTFSFTVPNEYAVFFNQSQNLALKDPSVRKALDMTAPRRTIVEDALNGRGAILTGPLFAPTAPLAYATDASTTAAAVALLDRAGWKMNADGMRAKAIKKSSLPLSFTLAIPDIPLLIATAHDLKNAWGAIGANVTVQTISPTDILQNIKNRDYQALLFGIGLSAPEDLYPFWHSSERFAPGLNLSLYNNPRADKLLESIRGTFDEASRTTELADLGQIIQADTPAVFLFTPEYLFVANKDLRGVSSGTLLDQSDRLRDIHNWYINTARVFK